ncbi:MAG: hypothetical protein KDC83_04720 [Flavobacteriales bacterium]|nr:hypothetical protein [Flavobacteriales bacterium]
MISLLPSPLRTIWSAKPTELEPFDFYLRLKEELRPDVAYFYHHLREGMKLHAWISDNQLELTAKGFLICKLRLDRFPFRANQISGMKFIIHRIEKQKYLPCKSLEIKVIEIENSQRK